MGALDSMTQCQLVCSEGGVGGSQDVPSKPSCGLFRKLFFFLESPESSAQDPLSSMLAWGGGRLNLLLLWRQNSC